VKKLYFIRANQSKYGGAEVYLSRLSKALKERGINHHTIHSNLPKRLPSWVRVLLFNRWVCRQKKQKKDFYFSLERISCPDIYRAGDGVHKVFVEVEKKSFLNPLHAVYIALEKRCFQHAGKIIANSKMIKDQIIDTYGISPEKIEVVYNGVTIKPVNVHTARAKLKSEFGIDEGEKVILYVGSGFQRKGVKELLQLLSQLNGKPFRAFIVGKEKRMEYYQALADELGLREKVVFTDARDDVEDFYAVSDIFLFPTRYEPFSNVVLEAMAYGNAVITTKQNGASEILPEDLVMASPSDETIVAVLQKLFEDEEYLAKVQQENLEIVKNFNIEKNVKETLRIIDEVIR